MFNFPIKPLQARQECHNSPLDARTQQACHVHRSLVHLLNTSPYFLCKISLLREYQQLQCKCDACHRFYSYLKMLELGSCHQGDEAAQF